MLRAAVFGVIVSISGEKAARPDVGPAKLFTQALNGKMKQQTGSEISREREVGSPASRGPWGQMSTPPEEPSVKEKQT